jgi:hypothetical protein
VSLLLLFLHQLIDQQLDKTNQKLQMLQFSSKVFLQQEQQRKILLIKSVMQKNAWKNTPNKL